MCVLCGVLIPCSIDVIDLSAHTHISGVLLLDLSLFYYYYFLLDMQVDDCLDRTKESDYEIFITFHTFVKCSYRLKQEHGAPESVHH